MFKKILLTSALAMSLAGFLQAAEGVKPRVEYNLYGSVTSYYKVMDNYKTPLDSSSTSTDSTGDTTTTNDGDRNGANNRASQNSRTSGELTLVAKSGKNLTDGIEWYNWIGVLSYAIDLDDPDNRNISSGDGDRATTFHNNDAWVRYSPILPIGIKLGTQTITATSNAANIHYYEGDNYDNDFIAYYAASTISAMPGATVDLHLSKDIEVGFGRVQGMGDASAIATGGSSSEAMNDLFWAKAKFGFVELAIAQQNIAVGETEDEASDPAISDVYQHEKEHSLMNFSVKAKLGIVTPYIGYQTIAGDKVSTPLNSGTPASFGFSESEELEGNFTSIGVLADIGPGQLAVDYTSVSTPEYGEKGSVAAIIGLDSVMMTNYKVQADDGVEVTLFYHTLKSKEDSKLKEFVESVPGITQAYREAVANNFAWSDTTSFGVSLKIAFGR